MLGKTWRARRYMPKCKNHTQNMGIMANVLLPTTNATNSTQPRTHTTHQLTTLPKHAIHRSRPHRNQKLRRRMGTKPMKTICKNCNKTIHKPPNEYQRHKNHFCTQKCFYQYRKTHMTEYNNKKPKNTKPLRKIKEYAKIRNKILKPN